MRSRDLYDALTRALTIPVSADEKQAIIRWLLEERSGLNTADLMAGKEIPLQPRHFEQDIKRLNDGEPLQYLLGHAEFYGRRFKVNKSVLVPRPETELLVGHVVDRLGKDCRATLLDIGTGSGCIAITLALELPGCKVIATDVDPHALSVARENARLLNATVDFRLNNILTEELPHSLLDAVVSNPPYIRTNEKMALPDNVKGHEPHGALFVPDDDPLVFHRAIAQKAKLALNPGGLLGMEINEALGSMTKKVVEQAGFTGVTIHQDLDGKDRFVSAVLSV
jgi:release factor glutamine methyltransferase